MNYMHVLPVVVAAACYLVPALGVSLYLLWRRPR